ncbi:MAG: hypothetical protein ACRERE_36560 [Candidatus Entotheonellia bacterium]
MTFYEMLEQVVALLQRHGRVTYRALKRQFEFDDDYFDDLKAELIDARQLAVDEQGRVLVWTGGATAALEPASKSTPWSHLPTGTTRGPRCHAHSSIRVHRTRIAVNSRSCSVTWWTPRAWRVSSTRRTSARSCWPIKRHGSSALLVMMFNRTS